MTDTYMGIANKGNYCFANSILQLLSAIPDIRAQVVNPNNDNPIWTGLKNVFQHLQGPTRRSRQTGHPAYDLLRKNEFRDYWNDNGSLKQQDPADFLMRIHNHSDEIFNELTVSTIEMEMCVSCGYHKETPATQLLLTLDASAANPSLEISLQNKFTWRDQTDRKCPNSNCKKKTMKQRTAITNISDQVFLNASKVEFNPQDVENPIVNANEYPFPTDLSFDTYMKMDTTHPTPNQKQKFILKAVVVRNTSTYARLGHYWAFVKHPEQEQMWVRFEDENVRIVNESDMLDETRAGRAPGSGVLFLYEKEGSDLVKAVKISEPAFGGIEESSEDGSDEMDVVLELVENLCEKVNADPENAKSDALQALATLVKTTDDYEPSIELIDRLLSLAQNEYRTCEPIVALGNFIFHNQDESREKFVTASANNVSTIDDDCETHEITKEFEREIDQEEIIVPELHEFEDDTIRITFSFNETKRFKIKRLPQLIIAVRDAVIGSNGKKRADIDQVQDIIYKFLGDYLIDPKLLKHQLAILKKKKRRKRSIILVMGLCPAYKIHLLHVHSKSPTCRILHNTIKKMLEVLNLTEEDVYFIFLDATNECCRTPDGHCDFGPEHEGFEISVFIFHLLMILLLNEGFDLPCYIVSFGFATSHLVFGPDAWNGPTGSTDVAVDSTTLLQLFPRITEVTDTFRPTTTSTTVNASSAPSAPSAAPTTTKQKPKVPQVIDLTVDEPKVKTRSKHESKSIEVIDLTNDDPKTNEVIEMMNTPPAHPTTHARLPTPVSIPGAVMHHISSIYHPRYGYNEYDRITRANYRALFFIDAMYRAIVTAVPSAAIKDEKVLVEKIVEVYNFVARKARLRDTISDTSSIKYPIIDNDGRIAGDRYQSLMHTREVFRGMKYRRRDARRRTRRTKNNEVDECDNEESKKITEEWARKFTEMEKTGWDVLEHKFGVSKYRKLQREKGKRGGLASVARAREMDPLNRDQITQHKDDNPERIGVDSKFGNETYIEYSALRLFFRRMAGFLKFYETGLEKRTSKPDSPDSSGTNNPELRMFGMKGKRTRLGLKDVFRDAKLGEVYYYKFVVVGEKTDDQNKAKSVHPRSVLTKKIVRKYHPSWSKEKVLAASSIGVIITDDPEKTDFEPREYWKYTGNDSRIMAVLPEILEILHREFFKFTKMREDIQAIESGDKKWDDFISTLPTPFVDGRTFLVIDFPLRIDQYPDDSRKAASVEWCRGTEEVKKQYGDLVLDKLEKKPETAKMARTLKTTRAKRAAQKKKRSTQKAQASKSTASSSKSTASSKVAPALSTLPSKRTRTKTFKTVQSFVTTPSITAPAPIGSPELLKFKSSELFTNTRKRKRVEEETEDANEHQDEDANDSQDDNIDYPDEDDIDFKAEYGSDYKDDYDSDYEDEDVSDYEDEDEDVSDYEEEDEDVSD